MGHGRRHLTQTLLFITTPSCSTCKKGPSLSLTQANPYFRSILFGKLYITKQYLYRVWTRLVLWSSRVCFNIFFMNRLMRKKDRYFYVKSEWKARVVTQYIDSIYMLAGRSWIHRHSHIDVCWDSYSHCEPKDKWLRNPSWLCCFNWPRCYDCHSLNWTHLRGPSQPSCHHCLRCPKSLPMETCNAKISINSIHPQLIIPCFSICSGCMGHETTMWPMSCLYITSNSSLQWSQTQ